jgi:hypothetical protein
LPLDTARRQRGQPPSRVPTPADVALLLSAALETTRADVNAAALAQEAGEDRRVGLGRTVARLNERHLEELKSTLEALLAAAEPDAQRPRSGRHLGRG